MATSSISLKISKWDKKELWDLWQRDASNYKGVGKLKVFVRRCQVQVRGLDGPYEFRILYKSTKVEQKTSLLGPVFVMIWLYPKKCAGNKNGEGR